MHLINGQLRVIRLFTGRPRRFFAFWVLKCGPVQCSCHSGSIPNIRNYTGTSHHDLQQREFKFFNWQLVARPKDYHLRSEDDLLAGRVR